MPIVEAALGACEDRLRPILMTVVTMIAGMIPLIIEGGAGANGNRALAIGVTGGMAVGTLALVFVVPAFYIIAVWRLEHSRSYSSCPRSISSSRRYMSASRESPNP